jgi:hypothetical protein
LVKLYYRLSLRRPHPLLPRLLRRRRHLRCNARRAARYRAPTLPAPALHNNR